MRPATPNVIEHTGATPVFCDVRDDYLNLGPELLPGLLTERTKAILPVHLAGQPCDLDPIRPLDPSLPIVIISGYSSDDVAVRLAHLGVDRFVQKPFSPGGLGEAVGAVLRTGVVQP